MRYLKDLKNIQGKRVILRVDFNVPLRSGKVLDDFKIKATLPTIEFFIKKGVRVILISHLTGKQERKNIKIQKYKNTLKPTAKYLEKLLGQPVKFISDCVGPKVQKAVEKLKDGEIVLLENLRLHAGEEKNDPIFAKELAALGEVYVNDAFAVCHRAHASVVSLPKLLPSYMGLLLEREVEVLSKVMKHPQKPVVMLLGGVKISTKIGVIDNFLKIADHILIGGAMANTFFKAQGHEVGASVVEEEMIGVA